MTISIPVLFLGIALIVLTTVVRCKTGASQEDENKLKEILRKIYMTAIFIFSGVVGLLFIRLDPVILSSLPIRTADPTSGVVITTKTIDLLFGTTSLPILFDIIIANAVMALCFLALPMMVGFGLILLYPSFAPTGKITSDKNNVHDRVVTFFCSLRRTFLVFNHLRN